MFYGNIKLILDSIREEIYFDDVLRQSKYDFADVLHFDCPFPDSVDSS